jgi:hypothetical protein
MHEVVALCNPFRVSVRNAWLTQGAPRARRPWAVLFNRFAVMSRMSMFLRL